MEKRIGKARDTLPKRPGFILPQYDPWTHLTPEEAIALHHETVRRLYDEITNIVGKRGVRIEETNPIWLELLDEQFSDFASGAPVSHYLTHIRIRKKNIREDQLASLQSLQTEVSRKLIQAVQQRFNRAIADFRPPHENRLPWPFIPAERVAEAGTLRSPINGPHQTELRILSRPQDIGKPFSGYGWGKAQSMVPGEFIRFSLATSLVDPNKRALPKGKKALPPARS